MTTIPPWGTPTSGVPELVTQGGPAGGTPLEGAFFVIVEQLTGSGDSATWRADPPQPAGATRPAARTTALHVARTFRPNHPFSPQGRDVYRVSDDSYLVIVQGRTKSFHFRVTVAERV